MVKTEKEVTIKYEVGSNVVELDEKTVYLTKVLWETNLTYEDIKDYICK